MAGRVAAVAAGVAVVTLVAAGVAVVQRGGMAAAVAAAPWGGVAAQHNDAASAAAAAAEVRTPRSFRYIPVTADYRGQDMAELWVDRRHKLVYCNVRKNACSSWKQVMYRLAYPEAPMLDVYHIHMPEFFNMTALRGLPAAEAEAIVNDPSYTFFATIRDPLQRFASAYLDKCYSSDVEREQSWCGVPVTRGDASTVDAVIEHILSEPPYKVDLHFRPQHLQCGFRMLRDRFTLLRFDHVVDDGRALMAQSPAASPALVRAWNAALTEVFCAADSVYRQPRPAGLNATKSTVLTPERIPTLRAMYAGDYRFFADVLGPPPPL